MNRRASIVTALATAALLVSGCGSEPDKVGPRGVDGLEIPTPRADPADFVDTIDNPLMPWRPGSRWVYRQTGDEPETITVTVTDETKVVQGVTTTVVHDVVKGPDGLVIEDTYDWYAQDTDGNVWYFGEDSTEYDAKGRADTAGSWEAGVDGAQAGIVMLATPRVGDGYQQEYYAGEAEDQALVLSLDASVEVPFGSYDGVLQTEDTTPLEPDVVERKYYAEGVGVVLEEAVGGDELVELVEFTEG